MRFHLGVLTGVALVCMAAGALNACTSRSAISDGEARLDPPSERDGAPVDLPGLHNVVAFHDGYFSGGVPESPRGFDSLRRMGIRTIISVDGAAPDVSNAERRGMRYIHLPIGYNGFDEQRRAELVRATRDAMRVGPVYLHCHHGKHRSAAAAGAAAVGLGWMTPQTAVARMRVSGTSPSYTGLYACVSNATVLEASQIEAVSPDFVSVSTPTDFVQAMIDLDEIVEHLQLIKAAGWTVPKDHPDLVPAAEAGRLADTLRLLADSSRARREEPGFAEALRADAKEAAALESLLLGRAEAPALNAAMAIVASSCKDCHIAYRD